MKCLVCESSDLVQCLKCGQGVLCRQCTDSLRGDRCPHCRCEPFWYEHHSKTFRHVPEGETTSERFIHACGNPDIPVLEIGDGMGFTDYIDFLKLQQVTHPVMRGMDRFHRPFLVIKFSLGGPPSIDPGKFLSPELSATVPLVRHNEGNCRCGGPCQEGICHPLLLMQTFFQRYSDDTRLWMGCGHATVQLLNTTGRMDDQQLEFLMRILSGESVTITNDLRPIKLEWVGMQVTKADPVMVCESITN